MRLRVVLAACSTTFAGPPYGYRGIVKLRLRVVLAACSTTFAGPPYNLDLAGVSRRVAMQMAGHKTESIYSRYRIVSDSDLSNAAD